MILSKLFVHPVGSTQHLAPKRALTVSELFAKLQIHVENDSDSSTSPPESSDSDSSEDDDHMPPPAIEASEVADSPQQQHLETPPIDVSDDCPEDPEETPSVAEVVGCESDDKECEMTDFMSSVVRGIGLFEQERFIEDDKKVEEQQQSVSSVCESPEVVERQMEETLQDAIPVVVNTPPQPFADQVMGKWVHYMRQTRFCNDKKLLRVPQITLTFEKIEGNLVRTSYMSAAAPQMISLDGKWWSGERWSQLTPTAIRLDMSPSHNEDFMNSIIFQISRLDSNELIEKEVCGEFVSIRRYKRVLESPPPSPQLPAEPSTPEKPDSPTPVASPASRASSSDSDDDEYLTPQASPQRPIRQLWSGGQPRFF